MLCRGDIDAERVALQEFTGHVYTLDYNRALLGIWNTSEAGQGSSNCGLFL
jgi:hypothetical protein